ADALVDAEAAALDDAFLEAPALAARVLEIQVRIVDAVGGNGLQRTRERRVGEAERLEQQRTCDGDAFEGGFAGDHARSFAGLAVIVGAGAATMLWPFCGRCARFSSLRRRFLERQRTRVQRIARRAALLRR